MNGTRKVRGDEVGGGRCLMRRGVVMVEMLYVYYIIFPQNDSLHFIVFEKINNKNEHEVF